MRTKYVVSGLLVALAVVPAAAAQNPNSNKPPGAATTISLDAKPTPVVFGAATSLSGRVSGGKSAGVVVRLEQDDTRPYGDSYKPLAGVTATTAKNGMYAFAIKPLLNTQYRAIAHSSPPLTSGAKLVLVRTLVGIRVSDRTPRRGSLVRFSGSVFPAHDGRVVSIQKRSSSGRFTTVARKALADAGTAKSTYSRRVRVNSDGVYRVKLPSDGDHTNGFSRLLTLNVGG